MMAFFKWLKNDDTFDALKKRIESIEKMLLKFSGTLEKANTVLPEISTRISDIEKSLAVVSDKLKNKINNNSGSKPSSK